MQQRSVVVFGSSRIAPQSAEYRLAYEAGRAIGMRGLALVSGGYEGAMGAASRGAGSAGGKVVGITTSIFSEREPNAFLTEHHVEPDYTARMRAMLRVGDAYLVLPGALGTLSELVTAWCLASIQQLRGPIWVFEEPWRAVHAAIQSLPELDAAHNQRLTWVADLPALNRALDLWLSA